MVLDQGLDLVVLGENDNLHDLADPGEDLADDVEGGGIDHVLDDNLEDGVRVAGRLVISCTRQPLGGQCRR